MSHKGGEMFQIESVRLSINEHLTSVREEISFVVNERLSSVEQFMCSLFQREIETLVETLLERQDKLLDVILQPHVKRHAAALLYQCVESSLQGEMSSPEPTRTVSVKPEDLPDTRIGPVKQELEDLLDTRTSPVKQELEDLPDTTSTVNPGIAGASTMPAVQANPASDPSTQLRMSASSAADPCRQLRMSASAAAGPYTLLIMPPTADPATLSWSQPPPPPPPCVLLPQPMRNTPATSTTITSRPVPFLPAASVKPAIAGPSSRLIMPAPVTVDPSTRSWPQTPLLPRALLPLPVVGPSTRPIIHASRATPGIVHPSSTQPIMPVSQATSGIVDRNSTQPIMPVSQATPGTSDLSSTQAIMPASWATPGIADRPTSAPPLMPTTSGAQTGVGSHLSWGKSTYRKRKKMELTELSRCYSRLPLCKLCGRPAQRHRKYKKKTYCPVTMKSSSARLNNRVFGSYENFTSAVDNM